MLGPLHEHCMCKQVMLSCLQAYDLVAGTQGLTMSRFNTRQESHRQFPTLAQTRSEDGTSLKGTVRPL